MIETGIRAAHSTAMQANTRNVRLGTFGLGGLGRVFFVVSTYAMLVVSVALVYRLSRLGVLGFDFEGTIWRPAHAIAHGQSPYPPATFDAVDTGNPSLYPPLIFILVQPLLLLPYELALAIWLIILIAAPLVGLWSIGIRDPRIYVMLGMSFPLVSGVVFGNITLLLALPLALAWRLRARPTISAVMIGLLIGLKLFLWPLLFWLVVTKRMRLALLAALWSVVLLLVPWALIGFEGFAAYPDLLSTATRVFASHSMSLYGASRVVGASAPVANLVMLSGGAVLMFGVYRAARRKVGDARSFALAIIAGVILSPIVWPHYLVLLAPALAAVKRSAGTIWLIFPAAWVAFLALPGASGHPCCRPTSVPEVVWTGLHDSPRAWQMGGMLLLLALVSIALARNERPDGVPA